MKYNIFHSGEKDKAKILFTPGWNNQINKDFINYLGHTYEILAVSLEGIDPTIKLETLYSPKEYVEELETILDEQNFIPDIIIAHSCGNKFISNLNVSYKKIIYIAPSIFKPRLALRLKRRYKIIRNKAMKKLCKLFHKNTAKKYLGSMDYQSLTKENKELFMTLKDYYPKSINKTNATLILFKNDSEIDIKSALKGAKKHGISDVRTLKGYHSSLYDNPEQILKVINENEYI